VSITGWAAVTPAFADTARRYVAQVTLSLRPSTVKCIERDLREFGSWLTLGYPAVASCADLERHHIEGFKTWLVTTPRKSAGGKPLNRSASRTR
jgi:integrase/recombinase XerD